VHRACHVQVVEHGQDDAFLVLTGGPAFNDGVHKFNRAMNRGGELAAWFATQLGSTQCQAITEANPSSTAEVEAYLQGGEITTCQLIGRRSPTMCGSRWRRDQRETGLCNRGSHTVALW
jgi:hypothetical protein